MVCKPSPRSLLFGKQVKSITEQLIANSNERTVFNGIEFYLPQLAHMIIHLEVDLPSSALEQFALVVSDNIQTMRTCIAWTFWHIKHH